MADQEHGNQEPLWPGLDWRPHDVPDTKIEESVVPNRLFFLEMEREERRGLFSLGKWMAVFPPHTFHAPLPVTRRAEEN